MNPSQPKQQDPPKENPEPQLFLSPVSESDIDAWEADQGDFDFYPDMEI